ncbi:MAG: cellulase family glycosylhydrolase [Bacteroidota bacterium]
MKIYYYLFAFLILLVYQNSSAQLTPQQAVAEMGRGINLGNTLEPPTEGAWNNGPAQESFFDAYLNAGFSNVRVPVRWDQHTANSAPFAIDTAWMNRVEQVVDWGLARGFYITLNGHHEDWLKNNYNNPTLRARYDSIWVQVAERFKNKSEKLLFEIINEPNGMTVAQVDDLNQRILGIIRQTNPTRIVIYGGNMYANSAQLLNAAILNDNFIIGYYHAYDPWQFSGQGMGTWGTANDYQQLINKYQSVKNWSVANNIPVHHSEFGAVLSCDFNSRMRIYAHNVEQCVVNGFAFSVWDDGGNFGILNRSNNTWPEVKDILMHYYQDSPNQIFSTYTPDPITNAPAIVVDWNNRASGNGDIILERSISGSSNFMQIATLAANATSYTDTSVTVGSTYTYRMYTTRADGTLLHGYPTRTKITATIQSPYNASALPIPGTIEVEEYDNGGEGLAYHDNDPANIPGGFRTDEGVDIGASGNAYILEYVESGEWIEYTVDVAQAGRYSVTAEVASEVANGTFDLVFAQNNASTDFAVPSTGSWYSFQQISANGEIDLEAGQQEMRLNITNNNAFNVDNITFTLEAANAIDPAASRPQLHISPNPTTGLLKVELEPTFGAQSARLELYTLTGKKLTTFSIRGGSNELDLGELARGLYLLQLVSEDGRSVQRLMIE